MIQRRDKQLQRPKAGAIMAGAKGSRARAGIRSL